MAGYKKVDPNLPGRIMTMAEETAAHNRKMQTRGWGSSTWISTLLIVAGAWRDDVGIGVRVFYVLVGIFLFSRLPGWWHSWRRPPSEDS